MNTYDKCRYGECVQTYLDELGAKVFHDSSESDYQGYVKVLAEYGPEGAKSYVLIEYSYGSCSGCDQWEAENLSHEQIVAEIRRTAGAFNDRFHLHSYLMMLEKEDASRVHSATTMKWLPPEPHWAIQPIKTVLGIT